MKVAFLWHMHQPCYIKEGKLFLPFVFLHAIKDYFDMPYLVYKLNKKATFNLTPILIKQLQMYEDINNDYFLSLMLKNVEDLISEEIEYLNKIFDANYLFLNDKLKKIYKKKLNNNEFLNKEVLFLLNWCGDYLKSQNFIKNYLKKDNFTQKEKEDLIFYLADFVKEILPFYKKLLNENVIDITTTPYAHPILPLMIDNNLCKVDNYVCLKNDVIKQIKLAKTIFKETFEKDVKGFWPAEGSVSEDVIELFRDEGIEYIFTDEIILHNSCENCDKRKVYEFNGVKIFFRNHYLSDLIGFNYRFLDKKEAVNDFISKLNERNFIVLDGENAWEYYKNGGYDFLEEMYKNIDTIFFKDLEKEESLEHLKAGSWIDGNFKTWCGDEVKNRAWSEVFRAKRIYKNHKKNREIEKIFLLLEGSDWYWWYGVGHYSFFKKEFDEIFRENLKKIYLLMNVEYPKYLDYPFEEFKIKQKLPKFLLKINHNFFDFVGSGEVENVNNEMHQGLSKIKKILYGENINNIYVKIIGKYENIETDKEFYFDKDILVIKKDKKGLGFEIELKIDNEWFYLFSVKENYYKNWYV